MLSIKSNITSLWEEISILERQSFYQVRFFKQQISTVLRIIFYVLYFN